MNCLFLKVLASSKEEIDVLDWLSSWFGSGFGGGTSGGAGFGGSW